MIDLEAGSITCPAGEVIHASAHRVSRGGTFYFDGQVCAGCTRRETCTRRDPEVMRREGRGRSIRLHPLEAILQRARALENTERIQSLLKQRPLVERRLAHLMYGRGRGARYRGTDKTHFQALVAALVVNLVRMATLWAIRPCHHGTGSQSKSRLGPTDLMSSRHPAADTRHITSRAAVRTGLSDQFLEPLQAAAHHRHGARPTQRASFRGQNDPPPGPIPTPSPWASPSGRRFTSPPPRARACRIGRRRTGATRRCEARRARPRGDRPSGHLAREDGRVVTQALDLLEPDGVGSQGARIAVDGHRVVASLRDHEHPFAR